MLLRAGSFGVRLFNPRPTVWAMECPSSEEELSERAQVPNTRYRVSGTRYQVPGTRYQVPGVNLRTGANQCKKNGLSTLKIGGGGGGTM